MPRFPSFVVALVFAASLASMPPAHADVTDPAAARERAASDGTVVVRWADPATFSELRLSGNRREAARGDWIAQLAEHLAARAQRALPPGARLEVEITDIRRAGAYEPWRGIDAHDIRFLRDIYPPRVWLDFRLTSADGAVVAEGSRALSDPMYLSRGLRGDSDPLRHEKRLLDDWLRRELPRDGG